MKRIDIKVPVSVPGWMADSLRGMKRQAKAAVGIGVDLWGDREVEWSYVAGRMGDGPGRLLDFGASAGNLSIVAAQRGFEVLALDLGAESFPWKHPKVEFLQGDLLKIELPAESFDVILNCSAVEHVGLEGRYGVSAPESDGDLEAMRRFARLMKPGGKMVMTIPCGLDAAIAPWHRVYGAKRLPKLLEGYQVEEGEYWVKRPDNRWYLAERETALGFKPTGHPTDPTKCSYALGCFVLRRGE
jgi:SAM-dependent methyltransferase